MTLSYRRRFIAYAGLLFLSGCESKDRFQLSKDGDKTVRLDTKTGEITILENGVISSPKTAEAARTENAAVASELAKLRRFPVKEVESKEISVSLATAWRDGSLLFQIEFSDLPNARSFAAWVESKDRSQRLAVPDSSEIVDEKMRSLISSGGWGLQLVDENDFVVSDIKLLGMLIYTFDDKGKATGFSGNSQVAMSAETYGQIAGWTILYRN